MRRTLSVAAAFCLLAIGSANGQGVLTGCAHRGPAAALAEYVETLTFSFEPDGAASGALVYRWERWSFRIPLTRRGTPPPGRVS